MPSGEAQEYDAPPTAAWTGNASNPQAARQPRMTMNKWTFLMFAASMQMSFAAFAETATINGITWTYTVSEGKVSIGSGTYSTIAIPTSTEGLITIPSNIRNSPVMAVGDFAFEGCANLTGVVIPEGVISIGEEAFFGCRKLEQLFIPTTLKEVKRNAFANCQIKSLFITDIGAWCYISYETKSLEYSGYTFQNRGLYLNEELITDIDLPYGISRIGELAFEYCQSLTHISIPTTVKEIGVLSFAGCTNLLDVIVPNGVRTIGNGAFWGSGIRNAIIGDDTITIDYHAFEGCNNLTNVIMGNSIEIINDFSFRGCMNLTDITIPNSVVYLGRESFGQCCNLTNIILGTSISSIERDTFNGCAKLIDINIPCGVTNISTSAFSDCKIMQSFYVSEENQSYKSECGLLITKNGNTIVSVPRGVSNITIPDEVSAIGNYAFEGCCSLTNITLQNSITNIGVGAFYGCRNLNFISLPKSLWGRIPESAFDGCASNLLTLFSSHPVSTGTYKWVNDSLNHISENVSLRSGRISNDESSWIEITVNGSGQISFWWKASSEEYAADIYDYAYLSIDGVPQGALNNYRLEGIAIGGQTDWTNIVLDVVGDGPHTIRWTYCKDNWDDPTSNIGEDCVWLDEFSFTPKPTISFDIGTNANGNAPDSIHAFAEAHITLPNQTGFDWADHVFNGWTDGISQYAPGANYTVPSSNVTLTAIWIAKSFVSFDIGGGYGTTPEMIKALPDETITLPTDGGFAWTDHVFDGWSDGANDYAGGADYAVPSSNVTLAAKWIAKSFVSFDIGNGTGTAPETIKDVPNAIVTLPMDDGIEWTDHIFNGWSDGESVYPAGTDYIVPTSNITLTVEWIAKSFISFDIGSGTGETPQTIKALPDEIISLPTGEGLTLTDCAFGGWTDGAVDFAAGGDYSVPASNVVLSARWIAKRFLTFTLDGGDGEIPITIKDIPNAKVTLPSGDGLYKAKHTFIGWNDGTQTYEAGAEYVVTDSSVEFTAVWTANTLDAPVITSAGVANGGTIETESSTIEIAAEDGTAIYYTMDGTEPTTNSALYAAPFTADGMSVTIKAFAVRDDYFDSEVAEFAFTRKPYSAAECINADGKSISTGGADAAWVRVLGDSAHDGVAALRSGTIGDGETSTVEMTVEGAGQIAFWWKVSSERETVRPQRYDYVSFLIDGEEQKWLGGEKNWMNEVFAVSGEGAHTLKWVYQKNDNGLTQGEDCAWLDEVTWTPWREITTKQTAVPIPYGWLEAHGLLNDTDAETAAKRQTGKRDGSGRFLTVEDDFIAGTDPTNENDLFSVSISISNGVPVVTWKPDLNTNGANRVYTIYGKESLSDVEWMMPTNALCRFFKVGVAMPTVNENNDSTGGGNGGEGGNGSGGNDSGEGGGGNSGSGDTGSIIPSGYLTNDVQCVSCTGSEWYDLGLPPTLTMKTQIKCSFAGENEHMGIIGVLPASDNDINDYRLFIASSPYEWFLDFPDSSRIHGSSATIGEVREVEFGNFYIKDLATDTILVCGSTVTASCPTDNIRLFRTNYAYLGRYTTGSVYYVKIYDLNTSNEYELVRNLVPCKSDANEVGLFDLVERKFYKSNGTNVAFED